MIITSTIKHLESHVPTNQTEACQQTLPLEPQSLNIMNKLSIEWQTLHGDYEKYEQFSLLIKLFSAGICLLCVALSISYYLSLMFILILSLQEGIWKTYQARTGERLLALETALNDTQENTTPTTPFSFYSAWEEEKPGAVGLVIEYISNALRPTVIYPYVVLIIIPFIDAFA